jgi:hypothetical protein
VYGDWGLFILRENFAFVNMTVEDMRVQRYRPVYQLVCGDCFVHGLEDGQGIYGGG